MPPNVRIIILAFLLTSLICMKANRQCKLETSLEIRSISCKPRFILSWSKSIQVSMEVVKTETHIGLFGNVLGVHKHVFMLEGVELPIWSSSVCFDQMHIEYNQIYLVTDAEQPDLDQLVPEVKVISTEGIDMGYKSKGLFTVTFNDVSPRAGLKPVPVSCNTNLPFYNSVAISSKKRRIINSKSKISDEQTVLILQLRSSITVFENRRFLTLSASKTKSSRKHGHHRKVARNKMSERDMPVMNSQIVDMEDRLTENDHLDESMSQINVDESFIIDRDESQSLASSLFEDISFAPSDGKPKINI